jgi:ornithine cyclodeaminase
MRTITYDEIRRLVRLEDVIEPVQEAFKSYSRGAANIPPVQHLEMPQRKKGALHIKTGHVEPFDFCLVKVASTFPENTRREPPSPSINGVIMIFSALDGEPLAVLADAVLHVAPGIRRVLAWGRTPDHARRFADSLRASRPDLTVEAKGHPEEVARESDIVVTTTYAAEPIVRGAWLPEGVLVIAMGADSIHKRELDSETIAAADKVYVDSRSQNEILGEVGHGIRTGLWDASRIDAELGEVLIAADEGQPGRTSDGERIIAKLTGVAVQEIFVCDHVLRAFGVVVGDKTVGEPALVTAGAAS